MMSNMRGEIRLIYFNLWRISFKTLKKGTSRKKEQTGQPD
jgi:hypothetical protein